MTHADALAFWYGRINYEVRAAGPGDLKLERMRALLRLLGDPHDRLRVVHVTGTKGKGSTCAMLAAVLRAAGYRVGLFTSPHLERVEERIQVDGVPITAAELVARMEEVAPAVRALEAAGPGPTFFEIGTALGFLHFVRRRVDVAVVEVGLGGRFDSTNVVAPLVAVVTSVGLDHTAQLGNTVEAIAWEKGGIIKRRVPAVSGVTDPGPRDVIRKVAADLGAPLWELGRDFGYEYRASGHGPHPLAPSPAGGGGTGEKTQTPPPGPLPWEGRGSKAEDLLSSSPSPWGGGGRGEGSVSATIPTPRGTGVYRLGLLGGHQAHNAAVAVAALDRLRDAGLSAPDRAVRDGLAGVRWPARVELVGQNPWVVLDTAHNVPSAEALVNTLSESVPAAGRKSVVLAVSADKDVPGILRALAGYFDHFHLTRYGNNPRGVPPGRLSELLAEVAPGTAATVHPTAAAAWQAARAAAGPDDLVCVTGSVFLAGELRPHLIPPTAQQPFS